MGIVVNPLAGLGGPAALKGSDGEAAASALSAGFEQRSGPRMQRALSVLEPLKERIHVFAFDGPMGAELATDWELTIVGKARTEPSTAEDSVAAAQALKEAGCDLILFAGGDGTARDIYRALGESVPVLGVPAGVKMHSGVYAVSPESAAEIVAAMVRGEWVDVDTEEVRDIDEVAFREGRVSTRFYGELLVPQLGRYLQATKVSGREVEELAVADIAAEVLELMDEETLYIIGPGSTTAGIMEELGLDNTLLGIDAVCHGQQLGKDLSAHALEALCADHPGEVVIIVTAIGGQGHILGRGNQQITPAVIRRAGPQNLWVVATKTKLTELDSRPLLVDTNDRELDLALEGYVRVITGYRNSVLYRVSCSGD
ncbi:putative polyphosphate/ATP-dependent NAD kinase [Litorivivens lipolytica]|uniref:Putative polyphosphate/ATP-dependent NAD kinase n=1 Tax=Litorivivens lipolytica TaxID=1524264 RepID=A0A7W4W2B8_9GAMM|nr:putative polyphosphate/ATP-dependent NAD kinase [Litorivivens lipolytica]